jgi:hypothetical protein
MQLPSKALMIVGAILSLLGVAALGISFALMAQYEAKAILAQRVEKDEAGALFDDPYRKVGSPQQYVIDDPKAFLPDKGEDGVALLSEDYLLANNIYPTQLQSLRTVINYGRIAAAVVFVLGDALLIFGLFKRRKQVAVTA